MTDQEKHLAAAQSLQALFDSTNANLDIVRSISELNSHKFDNEEDDSDGEDLEMKDPAVVTANVSAQMSYLRKLKYQYLEQNAKDRYVKLIVSDVEDAPVITQDNNKQLEQENMERKEKLKITKASLAELYNNIRTLSPTAEEDYVHVKQATAKATELARKIIDARLALSRLRQTHPHPRITVQTADKKLEDQVIEMQSLTDEMQDVESKVHDVKGKLKAESLQLEDLKVQRNEAEKNVKLSETVDDDRRFIPLYDWVTKSLALHRSLRDLEDSEAVSENELKLRYRVEDVRRLTRPIAITLLFVPNTRQLASVNVEGLEGSEINLADVIDAHLQMNNIRGVVATILTHVREGM